MDDGQSGGCQAFRGGEAEILVERRLAAIHAADFVGYSRLMGTAEAATLSAPRALRTGLIEPTIAMRNGRIVKLVGDGALVEFAERLNPRPQR